MVVDGVMVGMVADELRRASDVGELRSRSQLREAVGVGAGDLEAALAALRDAGKATEVEPDAYRLVQEGDLDDEPAAAATPEPGLSLAEAEARVRPPAGTQARARMDGAPVAGATVTMPRAMVDALDAPALGALLKAGIDSSEPAVSFVFEVTP